MSGFKSFLIVHNIRENPFFAMRLFVINHPPSFDLQRQVFGKGFVSTGGLSTTKEFVGLLSLKPDEYVLDVGTGIGGGPVYMAKVPVFTTLDLTII